MAGEWHLPDRVWTFGELPRLMGILNVTPDSFSDGGRHNEPAAAVDHALKLIDDGVDMIDVGGESTRPGAAAVSAEEERDRVVPVISQLREQTNVPISVDTTKASVAQAAVDAGATVVNDISGLTFDDAMIDVCAGSRVGVVCMHILGNPQTMQDDPCYDDCVTEVRDFLSQRLELLSAAGIEPKRVCLDPGIGFGKTADHNLELMRGLSAFDSLRRPLLIGHSRKRFLSRVLGRAVEERLAGTIGVAVALAERGVDVIRVHDVAAVRDALVAWNTVRPR